MRFRYREVSQPDYSKTSLANAVLRTASERLCIPMPRIRWFRADECGPLSFESKARPSGFVSNPFEIWVDADCGGRWLCFVVLHEARHVKQRIDYPEDGLMYSAYPVGLKECIEDTANAFAGSFLRDPEYLRIFAPFAALGGL